MRERFRVRSAKVLVAAMAGSLLLLATPGTASAGHGYRPHHDGHRHHARHYRGHDYRHGFGVVVGGFRHGYARGYRHGYADGHRGAYRYARHAFYCERCRHGYGSRVHFDRHLHHHHNVPSWEIPHVVVQTSIGLVFH